MAGAIAVLLAAGWGPQGPWDWLHPCGDRCAVADSVFDDEAHLDWERSLEIGRGALRLSAWKAASKHVN
eukprot:219860-Pyramimonas_sp.AAC.1